MLICALLGESEPVARFHCSADGEQISFEAINLFISSKEKNETRVHLLLIPVVPFS